MILNLHERWLLRSVRMDRKERRALLAALVENGQNRGEVDFTPQVGQYTLPKRSVVKDLATLFDRLLSPYDLCVAHVVYGDRRYRKAVILAAALWQADVSAAQYRVGAAAGYRQLVQFKARTRDGEHGSDLSMEDPYPEGLCQEDGGLAND